MGYLKYVRKAWKKPQENMPDLWRERLLQWRKDPATLRIERPTRIDRARSLGYRAKPGFVLVRQRVERGGRMREKFKAGRRSKTMRRLKIVDILYRQVAEQRANAKFQNCEVLSSYWVAKDGNYYWFEVVLVDRDHPQIAADKELNFMSLPENKGRVFRGLTAVGKSSRGLFKKGKGAEKIRPSQRANDRMAK